MAVHWTITFLPLRTNDTYTVNIYDSGYSGTPVPLKGGAQPFSTQEDDDDDMFRPVRTQSGYLCIVDDGKDADGHAFNWKSMLPTTDTDRPVTLTNAAGTVLWQGFMQAQNFGGVLYGNPQEREFPVQCALTVLEGTDINYQHTEIENFAYLLQRIVNCIDVVSGGTEASDGTISVDGDIHISNIYVQGGSDARQWLLKLVDWQNFIDVDADGNIIARYNLYQCLEDICRFWGWTARTFGQTLYLMRADDDDEQTFLTLTRSDLTTLAGGELAGTTSGTWSTTAIGNEFASVANNDFQQRGPNRATVTGNGNAASNELAGFADEATEKQMKDLGWGSAQQRMVFVKVNNPVAVEVWAEGEGRFRYTNPLLSFTRPFLTGECQSGNAAFCLMYSYKVSADDGDTYDVIAIKSAYVSGAAAYASLKTVYHHAFYDGSFQIHGSIYRRGTRYENTIKGLENIGKDTMRMRLGVGKTRATAKWWNGIQWTTTESDFEVSVGNKDDILRSIDSRGRTTVFRDTIQVGDGLSGQLFVEFLGTNTMVAIEGQRDFDIEGFSIEFTRTSKRRISTSGQSIYEEVNRSDHREYVAKNGNNVRAHWNADCIYASDNDMSFGFGVLANPDGGYFSMTTYGSSTTPERPEQHQADRVTAYWATAKRMLELELLSNLIANINPMYMVTVDGSMMHPIAIGRRWCDDVTRLTLIEL